MTTIIYDQQTSTKQFEDEFIIRPATLDDAGKAADLFNACNRAIGATGTETEEVIRFDWEDPEFNMATSTLAFFSQDGQMIAYQEMLDMSTIPVRPRVWGHVHPDYMGRGIGTYLFTWGATLANRVFERVPADARIVLGAGRNSRNPHAHDLLVSQGLMPTGQAWQKMLIELDDNMPIDPPAPDGLRWVTMSELNDTRKGYSAHREAFRDHRGFIEEDFEVMYKRWSDYMLDEKLFVPDMWYMLMDGDTIAAYSFNWRENDLNPDEGYVAQLGVTKAYRGRGYGKAVLLKSFHEQWKRGKRKVSLYVDGSSLTGANKLYMNAGMHVAEKYESYEKELRPGKEYSQQG